MKMFVRLFLLVAFVGSVVCSVVPGDESSYDNYPSSVNYRNICLQVAGGLCMDAAECPEGKESPMRGLCNFMKKGAVCCHSLPKSETRCQKHGGQCQPISSTCPITFERASDCSKEEKCCIFL